MIKATLLTLATVLGTATAWWDEAHLLTARIAYDLLLEEDPAALEAANAMLAVLKADSDILALAHENNYPFVECAPFADTVKGQGYSFQSDWHYVDNVYLDQDQNINDYNFTETSAMNVSSTIVDIISWLGNENGYEKTATYADIMKYFDAEKDGASFALRLLIHYVGDSHQPCHSLTRVDDKYPSGDRGCNSVSLPSKDNASNLHAVWDSMIYNQTSNTGLPLSSSNWDKYGKLSAEFRSKYVLESSKYHDNDPYEWAEENEALASKVYGGVVAGSSLSAEYIAQALTIAESHVSYGGRRLANTIKLLFGTPKATLFLQ